MLYVYVILTVFIGFIISLLFHELGHWFFSLFVGYKFKRMFLGPIIIEKTTDKLAIRGNDNVFFKLGAMQVEIKDIASMSRKGFFVLILGGPIASLILAIVSLVLFLYLFINIKSLWSLIALGLFHGSLTIFFISILPIQRKGAQLTDGRRLLEMLKQSVQWESDYNLWFLAQCYWLDVVQENEKEISEKIFYILNNSTDTTYLILALTFMLHRKMYLIEEKEIREQIDSILETASPVEQKWLNVLVADYV